MKFNSFRSNQFWRQIHLKQNKESIFIQHHTINIREHLKRSKLKIIFTSINKIFKFFSFFFRIDLLKHD